MIPGNASKFVVRTQEGYALVSALPVLPAHPQAIRRPIVLPGGQRRMVTIPACVIVAIVSGAFGFFLGGLVL